MDRDKRGDPDRRNPDDAKLRQDAQHQQVRVTGRQQDLELVVAGADQQVSGSDQAKDGPIPAAHALGDQDKQRQQK
jgi:hypothetical protein